MKLVKNHALSIEQICGLTIHVWVSELMPLDLTSEICYSLLQIPTSLTHTGVPHNDRTNQAHVA